MRLVIGLGNPGKEYADTRHNAGWLALDNWVNACTEKTASWKMEKRWQAEVIKVGRQTLAVKPHTFMNQSGDAVAAIAHFYRVQPEHILVLHDDHDLPIGTVRFAQNRGSAGHHGIDSIITVLGNRAFCRLRIGIAQENRSAKAMERVLDRFSKTERGRMDAQFPRLQQAINAWIADDDRALRTALTSSDASSTTPHHPPRQKRSRLSAAPPSNS